jgi:hypothetical protein
VQGPDFNPQYCPKEKEKVMSTTTKTILDSLKNLIPLHPISGSSWNMVFTQRNKFRKEVDVDPGKGVSGRKL